MRLLLNLKGVESRELQGYYSKGKKGTKIIGINIERLWKDVLNDKRIKKKNRETMFIKRYSQVLLHEHLHSIIADVLSSALEVGEERVIRACTGEKWTKLDESFYKNTP